MTTDNDNRLEEQPDSDIIDVRPFFCQDPPTHQHVPLVIPRQDSPTSSGSIDGHAPPRHPLCAIPPGQPRPGSREGRVEVEIHLSVSLVPLISSPTSEGSGEMEKLILLPLSPPHVDSTHSFGRTRSHIRLLTDRFAPPSPTAPALTAGIPEDGTAPCPSGSQTSVGLAFRGAI